MELDTIRQRQEAGKPVSYAAKKNTGKGAVTEIATKRTGTWVTINDAKRGVYVTVRPSQVSAAR